MQPEWSYCAECVRETPHDGTHCVYHPQMSGSVLHGLQAGMNAYSLARSDAMMFRLNCGPGTYVYDHDHDCYVHTAPDGSQRKIARELVRERAAVF